MIALSAFEDQPLWPNQSNLGIVWVGFLPRVWLFIYYSPALSSHESANVSPPLAGSSYFISINHFVASGVWPNFSMATDLHLILPRWVSSAPLPHAGAAVPKVSAPKRFKLFHITVFTFFSIIFTRGTEKWEHNSPTSEVFRAMLARGWKYPHKKKFNSLEKGS